MSGSIHCYIAKDPERKGKQIVEGIVDPVSRHSLQGRLEWGSYSNGAKDLAFNILRQWFEEEDAERYHLQFAASCIARLPAGGIEIERDGVGEWLEFARSSAEGDEADDRPDAPVERREEVEQEFDRNGVPKPPREKKKKSKFRPRAAA